ncbi:MAG: hypothetical protein ACJ75J_09530 [Cytophagaceae bacterium]
MSEISFNEHLQRVLGKAWAIKQTVYTIDVGLDRGWNVTDPEGYDSLRKQHAEEKKSFFEEVETLRNNHERLWDEYMQNCLNTLAQLKEVQSTEIPYDAKSDIEDLTGELKQLLKRQVNNFSRGPAWALLRSDEIIKAYRKYLE